MGLVDFVKSRISGEAEPQEVVGTIVDGPTWLEKSEKSDSVLRFRIDSLPDVELQQTVSPLAPTRKKGDRVKVHYHEEKGGQMVVDWCEAT